MDYEKATQIKKELERTVRKTKNLLLYYNVYRDEKGRLPKAIELSKGYLQAEANYKVAQRQLTKFNAQYRKTYAANLSKERRKKYTKLTLAYGRNNSQEGAI